MRIQPQSILDIGIGYGKYGYWRGEYLQLWGHDTSYDIRTQGIDGIEVFEPYILDHHRQLYDHIYVGDMMEVLPTISQSYDLILLIDVLEHVDEVQGQKLILMCLDIARYVLISTPHDIGVQGTVYGNQYETHQFEWKVRHLRDLGAYTIIPNHQSLIMLMGSDSRQVMQGYRRQQFKQGIKRNLPWLSTCSTIREKVLKSR